jgi:hypothetical protein
MVLLLAPRLAEASPVIPPGKEKVVLGLLAPQTLGSEVTPGCTIQSVQIQARTIDIAIVAGDDQLGVARLNPPESIDGAGHSKSFRIEVQADSDDARRCIEVVRETVQKNDDGRFRGEPDVVRTSRTPSRPYDGNYDRGLEAGTPDHMTLTLYRVTGRAP